MSELPKGWFNSELCDVAEVVSGNAFKSKDFVENGIPVVKISNVQSGEYIEKNQEYLPESFNNKDNSRFIVTYNDLLIALTRPIVSNKLKVCTYPNKSQVGLLNQRVARLDVNEGFSKRFLHYYLSSKEFRESVQASMSETLQPNLSPKSLSKINIACPPLAEQQRIVDKLDEVLAQVDTIKARLDGIPALLKRFRQSVLASAVSGKLTEEWRGENKPTYTNKEFRDSITEYRYQAWLNEKTKKYEEKGKFPKSDSWKTKYVAPTFEGEHLETLPDGWIQDVLEGLVYISARIGWKGLKASEYTEEGPLFLSVHGLNHGTYVELSEAFHISEERYLESPEIMLKNDDILLCKDGAGIGKIAIVKGLDEKASINSSLLLIRAGKFFDTKFLYYLLSGPKMQALVHERMTGSAVPHLFQRDVKEFVLDVPPLTEQKEIVRLVDQYLAFADTIEAQVKKAQARVDNLTQSILAKAFRGELVAQEPNDEPADKLLERITEARKEAEALAKAAKKAEAAKKRAAKSV
ncbi:TPA: restriction endonuclease subunit S [Vibrio vulnificus]|nr:restriction endonuclease subunit S [Vibrio vulnificus]